MHAKKELKQAKQNAKTHNTYEKNNAKTKENKPYLQPRKKPKTQRRTRIQTGNL